MEHARVTAELTGHKGAVKCIDWSTITPGVLYTGGRDGDVIIWDIRCSGAAQLAMRMQETHLKKRDTSRQSNSVTALVQRDTGQKELITSSCRDG